MESQLCRKCSGFFSGTRNIVDDVAHHQTPPALFAAAEDGCYICKCVASQFQDQPLRDELNFALTARLAHPKNLPGDWLKLSIWQAESSLDTITVYSTETWDSKQDLDQTKAEMMEEMEPEDRWRPSIGRNDIWGFCVWPTKDIAANVGDWVPPSHLEDPKLVQLALSWYQECGTKHGRCREPMPTPNFMPTRLVYIGDLATGKVSVVASRSIPSSEYCTLSHCWGGFNPLKLLESNQDALKTDIELEALPASWKEAIHLAQNFGFSYIWIDSLCIVQDSAEDWRAEAATMSDVYSCSSLNIALAGAENSSERSFINRHKAQIRPCSVRAMWDGLDHKDYSVVEEGLDYRDFQESKLWNRAWVVQETYLSRRYLVLAKEQVYYQCQASFACETYPGWRPEVPQNFQNIDDAINGRSESNDADRWKDIVERYSGTGITLLSDRVIAIGGLARHFSGYLKDDYVAGLWRSSLPEQLVWKIQKSKQTFRPDEYHAPSWSWASIEGPVRFFGVNKNVEHLCEVESVNIDLINESDSYGQIDSGRIIVHGALIPVVPWEENRLAIFEQGRAVLMEENDHQMPDEAYDGRPLGAYYDGDECDDAGEYSIAGDDITPMLSRLGEDAELDDFRVTGAWRFYCLPIQSFIFDEAIIKLVPNFATGSARQSLVGQPGCFGLLLQRTERDGEFVRIGSFEVAGVEQVKHFKSEDTCRLSIV